MPDRWLYASIRALREADSLASNADTAQFQFRMASHFLAEVGLGVSEQPAWGRAAAAAAGQAHIPSRPAADTTAKAKPPPGFRFLGLLCQSLAALHCPLAGSQPAAGHSSQLSDSICKICCAMSRPRSTNPVIYRFGHFVGAWLRACEPVHSTNSGERACGNTTCSYTLHFPVFSEIGVLVPP